MKELINAAWFSFYFVFFYMIISFREMEFNLENLDGWNICAIVGAFFISSLMIGIATQVKRLRVKNEEINDSECRINKLNCEYDHMQQIYFRTMGKIKDIEDNFNKISHCSNYVIRELQEKKYPSDFVKGYTDSILEINKCLKKINEYDKTI